MRTLHGIAALVLPLALIGCSAGAGSNETPDAVAELAELVPEQLEGTTITVGVNADNPPLKFIDDDGEIAGFAVDQLRQASALLGLDVEFVQGSFDSMIPGIESGRFDALASLADIEERQSTLRFIDFMRAGVSWIAAADADFGIDSREGLCGHSVSVLRGSGAQTEMEELAGTCPADAALDIVAYPDTNAALLAVQSGEDDLAMVDSPAASYNVAQFPDRYSVAFTEYTNPLGIGFAADQEELVDAYVAALQHMEEDGSYADLADEWGLPGDDLITDFPVDEGPERRG